ncbi:unannotated protein [freshwater metagenome]|uniref:Unannotated protein n=1 Tax=freshwater metagenome TaxID=449393 RepID=A0A6J6C5J0_9ZZZZ
MFDHLAVGAGERGNPSMPRLNQATSGQLGEQHVIASRKRKSVKHICGHNYNLPKERYFTLLAVLLVVVTVLPTELVAVTEARTYLPLSLLVSL